MLSQVPTSEWCSNGSEAAICQLPFTPEDVEANSKIVFARLPDEPACAVVQGDGHVFLLDALEGVKPPNAWVTVSVRGDTRNPRDCLPIVCAAFGVSQEQLPWISPQLDSKTWLLSRVDDNGNKVPMWYFQAREKAECIAALYQERGHKQLYVVENAP